MSPGRSLISIIRVTDDSTTDEIHEAIAEVAALPATEGRERRINALLDDLLERRG